MRYWCEKVSLFGRDCWVASLGEGRHGAVSWRLLVPDSVADFDPDDDRVRRAKVSFPLVGWSLKPGPRGWLLLSRDDGMVTSVFEVQAGYRGSGKLELVEPELEHLYRYPLYRSPAGSLGVGEGCIFSAPLDVEVVFKWERTGRLYGSPASGLVGIRGGREAWSVGGVSNLDELAALRCNLP